MAAPKAPRKSSRPEPVILDEQSLRAAEAHLIGADPVLGGIIKALGPCELHVRRGDAYEQLCTAIIGQQLSVKAAHTIRERVRLLVREFTPERVGAAEHEELRTAGLSRAKIRYLKALSEMVAGGELDLQALPNLSLEEVLHELLKVPGIGRWTAEMFLLFNLGYSDVLSLGDAGLQRAVKKLYGPKGSLEKAGKKWRPYCSVASWYLWQYLDANLLEAEPGERPGKQV